MTTDQIIITNYGKLTSIEIGRLIGKSDACVRARAQKLGIVPKRATVGLPPTRLSQEDKDRIRLLWPLHSLRDVAKIVRRCPNVVRRFAKMDGLPSKQTAAHVVLNSRQPRQPGTRIPKLPQLQQPPVMDFTDAADLDTDDEPRARRVPLPPITLERIRARHEIEAVHWISLDELRHPSTHGEVEIPLPGGVRSFPCFKVVDEIVWGLTYRILSQFLDRYPDEALRGGPTIR